MIIATFLKIILNYWLSLLQIKLSLTNYYHKIKNIERDVNLSNN